MSDSQWFIGRDGQQHGPIADAELRRMAAAGELRPQDMVWCAGMPAWQRASTVPNLFQSSSIPPPLPPMAVPYAHPAPPAQRRLGDDPGMRLLIPVGLSGWAIAAGYLGLFSILLLPAPLAIVFSILAIRDIKKHPHRHGMGRAGFGLVMGIVGTILGVILLIRAATSLAGPLAQQGGPLVQPPPQTVPRDAPNPPAAPGPAAVTKAYYTIDDGATFFVDDIDKIPPFMHQGKTAYRVYVYTCDGGKTMRVSHLERYTPAGKHTVERMRSSGREDVETIEEVMLTGVEVKSPGTVETGWIRQTDPRAAKVVTPTCPEGGTVRWVHAN